MAICSNANGTKASADPVCKDPGGGVITCPAGAQRSQVSGAEALMQWILLDSIPLVLVCGFLVFCGHLVDCLMEIWLTQGISFQDEKGSTDTQKIAGLLDAVLRCNPEPTTSLAGKPGLSRFHFMRVLAFKELDYAARTSSRCRVLFGGETDWLWDSVLRKHLQVLSSFSELLKEVGKRSEDLEAITSKDTWSGHGLAQVLWITGLKTFMKTEEEAELLGLRARLQEALASIDLQTQTLNSLASLMTESQIMFKSPNGYQRLDSKGVCVRSLGRVLCQLMECAVQVEALVPREVYVRANVKVALKGNQMFRPSMVKFASALELATYNIVVAYYMAIPDVLGQGGAECVNWVTCSDKPQKTWKEQYLPRLQSYLAFSSSVLPAGETQLLHPNQQAFRM